MTETTVQDDSLARVAAAVKQELSRQLHDSVVQRLTAVLIDIENFKAEQYGRQSVLTEMEFLQQETRAVLNDLRNLLYELRGQPAVSGSFRLALEELLAKLQTRHRVRATLSVAEDWPAELPTRVALHLLWIVQEALNNVRLHSRARTVELILGGFSNVLTVTVADDGVGTAPNSVLTGLGRQGMSERAMLIGGRIETDSRAGQGTRVTVAFPKPARGEATGSLLSVLDAS